MVAIAVLTVRMGRERAVNDEPDPGRPDDCEEDERAQLGFSGK